jgi:hypothetical protein
MAPPAVLDVLAAVALRWPVLPSYNSDDTWFSLVT